MEISPEEIKADEMYLRRAEAADVLATDLDIRGIPLPPAHLLRVRTQKVPKEAVGAAAEAFVLPHWNFAVELINQGGAGYSALLNMRTRLKEHWDRVDRRERQVEAQRIGVHNVRVFLFDEAALYGANMTLRESLEPLAPPDEQDKDGWYWQHAQSALTAPVSISGDFGCRTFALRTPGHEGASDSRSEDFYTPRSVREFHPEATWVDCIKHVEDFEDVTLHGIDSEELSVISFRLEIIEQVLREHEVLGFVGEIKTGDGSPPHISLSEERRSFVRAALKAIPKVESDVDAGIRRFRSFTAVLEEVELILGWGNTRFKRVATELGAFQEREGEGGGPPTTPVRRKQYSDFCSRIREVALLAGIDTEELDPQ